MGKLKLAADLIKLNNKLGLLDVGDMIGLASTAYKVKTCLLYTSDAADDLTTV